MCCWKWRFHCSLPGFSVFIACLLSQPGLTFPIHYQMSLPLRFPQNFYYQGFGTSFLPDSRGRNASSFNPTRDKLWHILCLCLYPPQHPNRGAALCAPRAPHSLIPPPDSPQIWQICRAAWRGGSACTPRGRAALDPGFSSIPGPFCVLLQVQDLPLSLPQPWGLQSWGKSKPRGACAPLNGSFVSAERALKAIWGKAIVICALLSCLDPDFVRDLVI